MALDEAVDVLAAVVDRFDPATLTGVEARRLAELFSRGERICAAGKMLAARRVDECATWTGDGVRSVEEWLAGLSGTAMGAATVALNTAERLADQPDLEEAVKSGTVSMAQAAEIAPAAQTAPDAGAKLIEAAASGTSMSDLRKRCRQAANATASPDDDRKRAERLRAERFFRTWTDAEGAGRGQFKLAPADYARFTSWFKPFQDHAFQTARQAGRHETYDAYSADGLMAMAQAAANSTAAATTATATAAATKPAVAEPPAGATPNPTATPPQATAATAAAPAETTATATPAPTPAAGAAARRYEHHQPRSSS